MDRCRLRPGCLARESKIAAATGESIEGGIMIGYVMVGTNDLKKVGEFYDKICGELGMGRLMTNDRVIAWGARGGGAGFGVGLPFDGKPMTHCNGVIGIFPFS